MGHAIFNKLLGWLDKTLKKINFSGKHSFSPFKSGFGSMTLKKQTLMAALLVDVNFENVSLLFEIHIGKITHYYISGSCFGIWTFFGNGTSFYHKS